MGTEMLCLPFSSLVYCYPASTMLTWIWPKTSRVGMCARYGTAVSGQQWKWASKYEQSPGAWYVQGQTPTPEFTDFVNTYLTKWTGFVAETVFDVNCLVLDESHVIFSAYNKQVFDYCRKHGIEPIISELRHSYFWDGGISCCTQDIRRAGGLENYL
jgi:hypothetical protein